MYMDFWLQLFWCHQVKIFECCHGDIYVVSRPKGCPWTVWWSNAMMFGSLTLLFVSHVLMFCSYPIDPYVWMCVNFFFLNLCRLVFSSNREHKKNQICIVNGLKCDVWYKYNLNTLDFCWCRVCLLEQKEQKTRQKKNVLLEFTSTTHQQQTLIYIFFCSKRMNCLPNGVLKTEKVSFSVYFC